MHRSRSARVLLATAFAGVSMVLVTGVTLADGSVLIEPTAFAPTTVTIAAGEMVTWTSGPSSGTHTATADAGSFDTGPIDSGKSASVTFLMPGTFAYTCTILPTMKGTIVVTEAAAPSPTPQATPTPTPHRPPPTDLASGPTDGSGGTPMGLLLGLLLCGGALVAAGIQRAAAPRGRMPAWSVFEPGEAPRRGASVTDSHTPGTWTDDDRSRG